MFQFRRFPAYTYLIQCTLTGYCPAGFPHSDIPGSMDICSSPRLFAAYRVLLRLSVPRHSPCALSSLTNQKRFARSRIVNYAGFTKIEIVIVTHLYDVPQLLFYAAYFFSKRLSVALLHFVIHCSVFKVQSFQPRLKPDLKVQCLGL